MRRLTLFCLAVLLLGLVGCQSLPPPQQKTVTTTSTDLRAYTEEGFLITPSEYGGEFRAIGFLEVELEPSTRIVEPETENGPGATADKKNYDLRPGEKVIDTAELKDVAYRPPSLREAVDSLYVRAREMGADAIINFERSAYPVSYWITEVPGIRVQGFAIDRLDQ